jgi:hypothetical protein
MDGNEANENQEGNEPEQNSANKPTPEALTPEWQEAFQVVHGFDPSTNPEDAAKELLRENLVPAVQEVVNLAAYAKNERIRFEASKYVLERNLGKLADKLPIGDMWDTLFAEIVSNSANNKPPEEKGQ